MITKIALKFNKYPNLIRLGKKQKEVIKRMCSEGLVIKGVTDYRDNSYSVYLQDEEGDNICEQLTPKLLQSLRAKKLFYRTDISPSLDISVSTWKIKSGFIEETLINL